MHSFVFTALALAAGAAAEAIYATPHDKYSSSVGVLGCKINTNRVAYWPGSIDCDNICVKVSYKGRSVNLLRIDQSGGAHDISYDAWAYLQTGDSAVDDPISGGPVAMEYEEVDAEECADLIYTDGRGLPLSASNSINYLSSCLDQPSSWVAKNHILFNICDAICTVGYDEECELDLSVSNQPSCPHTLGLTTELTSAPVVDIEYQSGNRVLAGSGDPAPEGAGAPPSSGGSNEEDEGDDDGEDVPAPVVPTSVTAGVFVELTTSVDPVVSTTAPATTEEATTAEPVTEEPVTEEPVTEAPATSTSVVVVPTTSDIVEEVTTTPSTFITSAAPTTAPVVSAPHHNSSAVHTTLTRPGSSTLSVVTLSSTTFTVGSTPSSDAGENPQSAGHHVASAPALVLVASFICSMVVLF